MRFMAITSSTEMDVGCAMKIDCVRSSLVFVLIVIFSGWQATAHAVTVGGLEVTSAKLDVNEEGLLLASGDNVTLRCHGDGPLTWLRNGRPIATLGNRFTLSVRNDSLTRSEESHLALTNLAYTDTGEFSCRYVNGTSSAYIYVYVARETCFFHFNLCKMSKSLRFNEMLQCGIYNGVWNHKSKSLKVYVENGAQWRTARRQLTEISYESHLITLDQTILPVVGGRYAVLPCRPTHPNVTIRLFKSKDDVTNKFSFDSRKGFIVDSVTPFVNGMFECRAKMASSRSKVSLFAVYQAPVDNVTMVELRSNVSDNEVMIGESISIECKATVQSSISVLLMSWLYDRNKTVGRVSESTPMMSSRTTKSNITLSNVSLSDQGPYRCLVRTLDGQSWTEQLNIIVHEKPFMHFSGSSRYEVDAQQKLNVSVAVVAYPKKPDLAWFKDGLPIHTKNESRLIEYSRIYFNYVQTSDAGNYTVFASDCHHNRSFNFQLIVNGEPRVEIDHDVMVFYKAGQTYHLNCRAVGRPTPEVQWFWQPCANNSCAEMKDLWTSVTILKNETSEASGIDDHVVRGITVTAKESGLYSCVGKNRLGAAYTVTRFIVSDESVALSSSVWSVWWLLVLICIVSASVGFLAFVCCWYRRRSRKKYAANFYEKFLMSTSTHKYDNDQPLLDQSEHLAYDPRWEFPKDRLIFKTILGQGAFGTVVKAQAIGITESCVRTVVAVKMVKDEGNAEQLKILSSELKILTNIGTHLNIVNILGAVTQDINKGQLYLIMEYCRNGCLRDFLVNNRHDFIDTMDAVVANRRFYGRRSTTDENEFLHRYNNDNNCPSDEDDDADNCEDTRPLTTKDIACYAFQIARGMEFLSSKKYIHGDLAARNVLLSDDNVVKICDFGLAKNCYHTNEYLKKSNTPVPVKWMAIESLTHRVYNAKTDVWSFGVVLWELFTVGGNPYSTMTINEQFIEILKQGYRMEKPTFGSETTYMVMRQCWSENPDHRPNFNELADYFGNLLHASVRQHYTLLASHYETPRTCSVPAQPTACPPAPLNYVQLDNGSGSNSDADEAPEALSEELASCPATPLRVAFGDSGQASLRAALRQRSVESGVFSLSPPQRSSLSSKTDLQLSSKHDRSLRVLTSASGSDSPPDDKMNPWLANDGYIVASVSETTTRNNCSGVEARREPTDNKRHSRRSITSDLSGSVASDGVFEEPIVSAEIMV